MAKYTMTQACYKRIVTKFYLISLPDYKDFLTLMREEGFDGSSGINTFINIASEDPKGVHMLSILARSLTDLISLRESIGQFSRAFDALFWKSNIDPPWNLE